VFWIHFDRGKLSKADKKLMKKIDKSKELEVKVRKKSNRWKTLEQY